LKIKPSDSTFVQPTSQQKQRQSDRETVVFQDGIVYPLLYYSSLILGGNLSWKQVKQIDIFQSLISWSSPYTSASVLPGI